MNQEVEEDANQEELNELIGNEKLSEEFLKVAQDLDALDPKTPEDISKTTCTPNSCASGCGCSSSGGWRRPRP